MNSGPEQKDSTGSNSRSTRTASPESGGRLDRITDQTKGLVDDIKEWIDLRVRLVQLDLEERLETIANQTILTLVVIGIGAISIFFALIAAALGLGALFSNSALGFLAVSLILACTMWLVNRWRPRFVNAAIRTAARRGQEAVRKDVLRDAKSGQKVINAPLPPATGQNEKDSDERQ